MSDLRQEMDRYLTIRRSLGYDLGTAERMLRRFIAFAEAEGAEHVSADLFLRWQAAFGNANRQTWAARFVVVRRFAEWLHGLDPAHEIMPRGLIPCRSKRSRPYIYSGAEIARIIEVAAELPSTYGLRALTFSTLFGLIAVTGLRINEALALDTEDLDSELGTLTVQCGKLGKARLVPLETSVVERLTMYITQRDRVLGKVQQALFVQETGERISDCSARYNFASVSQRIGLRAPERFGRHGRGPRIHDLRHSFAARTIISWYRAGKDAGREMIKLSTYLGHSDPDHTYWYLEAVPELLELAAGRVTERTIGEA
jgi:integrase/recombinase XerD